MNTGIPFLDLILLAAVAGFVILQLRRALGRRDGHDKRPTYDPFRAKPDQGDDDKVVHLPDRNKPQLDEEAALDGDLDVGEPAEPGDLSKGLAQIRRADPSFDPDSFVNGASVAFEMVIAAFAKGDSDTLRPMLADDVYDNFATAIEDREEAKETLETTLVGISENTIIEAEMRQKTAFVTVKFVSEQINVTRDKEGEVADGDPHHVARITDIWTFARNTRSRDPNWTLVATRSPN